MLSLREILGRARGQIEPPALSAAELVEVELYVHTGRWSAQRIRAVLEQAARERDRGFVLGLIMRIHTAGHRDHGFLSFAIDYALATRDLAAADHYAASLRASPQLAPDCLFRVALVQHVLGNYGASADLLHEYLLHDPRSTRAREYLAECHLRQGSPEKAYSILEGEGLAGDRAEFLAQAGPRLQPNWLGRKGSANSMSRPHTRLWASEVLKAPLRIKTETVADVDRWLNTCRYVSDQRLFGESDYWQTPDATEARRAGDCEDFALWAWVQLLRQGVRARFVLGGTFDRENINHAWVQIHQRGQIQVLECTPTGFNIPIPAAKAYEYWPVTSLSSDLRWHDHV